MSIEAMKLMVDALSKVAYAPSIKEHPIAHALRVGRQAIAEAEKADEDRIPQHDASRRELPAYMRSVPGVVSVPMRGVDIDAVHHLRGARAE